MGEKIFTQTRRRDRTKSDGCSGQLREIPCGCNTTLEQLFLPSGFCLRSQQKLLPQIDEINMKRNF